MYKRTDKNVVTFHNDQEITEEEVEYPHGTVVVYVPHFQLNGFKLITNKLVSFYPGIIICRNLDAST